MTTSPRRRDLDALDRALAAGRQRLTPPASSAPAPAHPVQDPTAPLEPVTDARAVADSLEDIAARLTLGEFFVAESLAPILSAAAGVIRAGSDMSGLLEARLATVPTARATDPATSRNAAPKLPRRGTQAGRLLVEIARPRTTGSRYLAGLTSEEAAALAPEVSLRSEYAKRCSDLATLGLIVDTGATRPGASGHQRIVYRATDAGKALAARLELEDAG